MFCTGASLVVQWLTLCTSTEGGACSIPGRGTKSPHATQSSHPPKKNPIKINKCYEQKEGQAQSSVSKLCVHVFTTCCLYVCVCVCVCVCVYKYIIYIKIYKYKIHLFVLYMYFVPHLSSQN